MDAITAISFILGAISLALTIYYGNQSNKTIESIWNHVDQKIMDLLIQRLNRAESLSTVQVIGIVQNIITEYRVNMPSDKHIVRLLRRIALRYEEDDVSYHQSKLKTLEKIRKELEPKGPPLMSIAATSRSLALRLIAYGVLAFFLAIHVSVIVYSRNPNRLVVFSLVFAEILVASIMFALFIESRKILKSISSSKDL